MTDIASLSFNIDTSQVPPATDSLDKLSTAADKVRASTRFLVSNFSSTNDAIQQLATSGRASLASFVQISQNLDDITARLQALRGAAADTIGTFGGNGMASALTSFQQQFTAMATLFGTSAAQLEAFNKQAQYLQLNAYQVTSALQRITEAQQNMTPAGQAIRQALNLEHINMNGNPSDILRQVQAYYASHQNSQFAANTLQEILGPIDPATMAAFRYQPYRSIGTQAQFQSSQHFDTLAAQVQNQNAGLQYTNQMASAQYKDLNRNFSIDSNGVDREKLIREMELTVQRERQAGEKNRAARDQKLLDTYRNGRFGSEDSINAGAQFDALHPWNHVSLLDRTFSGFGELLGESLPGAGDIGGANAAGTPTWLQRIGSKSIHDAYASQINDLKIAQEHRAGMFDGVGIGAAGGALAGAAGGALVAGPVGAVVGAVGGAINGAVSGGIFGQNWGADATAMWRNGLNDVGLYGRKLNTDGPLQKHVGRNGEIYYTHGWSLGIAQSPADQNANLPLGANEVLQQDTAAAQMAQQFGYNGFSEALTAKSNATSLAAGGPNSARAQMERLFGTTSLGAGAGDAIINQQIGMQQYLAQNAVMPGFDQMQGLLGQRWQAAQVYGQDMTGAFLQFYKSQGLDPGRLGGLSMAQIMAGQGGDGVALTPSQIAAWRAQSGQIDANFGIQQQTQFTQQNTLASATLGLAQTASGPGQYEVQVAGLNAYNEAMVRTNDTGKAATAQADAMSLALKGQAASAALAVTALKTLNDEQATAIASGAIALDNNGQPGAYAAAQFQSGINSQYEQWLQSAQGNGASPATRAAYKANLERRGGLGLVSDVQGSVAQEQQRVFSSEATLGTFGMGFQARNAALAQIQFGPQLASAQSTGNPQLMQAVQEQVNKYIALNNQLDLTNAALGAMQSALSGFTDQGAYTAAAAAPPGQQDVVMAKYRAKAAFLTSQGDYSFLSPAQQSEIAPFAGYIAKASAQSGVPSSWLGRQVLAESSGNPSVTNGDAAGLAQFTSGTGGQYKLVGKGYDFRNDPSKAIPAMAKYDASLMRGSGGKWGNANDELRVAGKYGTIPQGMTINSLGNFVSGAAGQGVLAGDVYAGKQIGYGSDAASAQTAAALPFLRRGRSGDATLAQANIVAANVPDEEKAATAAAQIARAGDQLKTTAAGITADASIRTSDAQTMAKAYQQGPQAVIQAQATLAAQASGRQVGSAIATPAWLANATQENIKAANAATTEQLSRANMGQSQANALQGTKLSDALSISGPYAKEIANSNAQIAEQLATTYKGASQQMRDNFIATQQTAAQLEVIAQKQGVVQQNMSQIGSSVSDTMQNMAFSYQHGPGAGLYVQQQFSGLLNSGARSLFNTVIGDPVQRSLSSGLGGIVDSLMGLAPTASGSGAGAAASRGGGSSGASQTLGGISGLLGSFTGSGASSALGGLQSFLFGSSLGAHQGVSGAVGLLPHLWGMLSGAFANGGAFSEGQRMPFALGGTFGPGMRTPFAGGGVFNSPTTMPMALIGEAGPEAIMPLRRGADGKLGIATAGGGGGHSIVVNAPISVGQNGVGANGQMSQRQQADLQRQVHQTLTRAVMGVMADQSRPGGMIQPQPK